MADPNTFLAFIRTQMQIAMDVLPDTSATITFAYKIATDTVNSYIQQVSPDLYDQAVYNLGGDILINFAPDPSTTDPFFSQLRTKWGIGNFTAGVVQATSDQGTSANLLVQDAAHLFTLDDMQRLKTPYGRQYLYIAQKFGTLWGLT
jgi:hypothetical protein